MKPQTVGKIVSGMNRDPLICSVAQIVSALRRLTGEKIRAQDFGISANPRPKLVQNTFQIVAKRIAALHPVLSDPQPLGVVDSQIKCNNGFREKE
jgi:hypothetical protein